MDNQIYFNNINNNKNKMPIVSVIIPTYNRSEMLYNAINSIVNQTFNDFEIIIINDGGVDVKDVIDKFNGVSIKYFRHEKNRGMAAARNTGIRAAQGKYIAYLDDDDIYYPDHLETLINFLENSEYKVAYTNAYECWQEKSGDSYKTIKKELKYNFHFDKRLFLLRNYIPTLCIMHDKKCIIDVGYFDEKFKTHEDWELWIRISRKYDFKHLDKITCGYSRRSDNTSTMHILYDDLILTKCIIYFKYYNNINNDVEAINYQKTWVKNNLKKTIKKIVKLNISKVKIKILIYMIMWQIINVYDNIRSQK